MCETDHQIVLNEDGTIPGVPCDCAIGEACVIWEDKGKRLIKCARFDFDFSSGPIESEDPFCEYGLEEGCPLADASANTPFEMITKEGQTG